jgi:hypothetical protein
LRDDLSREDIERLLDGRAGTPVALVRLLSAARSAAHPGELDGEEAVVAAFHSAHPSAGRVRPPAGMGSRTTARLLAAVGAIAAAGGVGVAAATGALPGNGWPGHPSASRGAVPNVAAPARTPRLPGAGGATGPGSTDGPAGPGLSPGATPDLLGLCRAYLAMAPREAQHALGTPPFAQLVGRTPDPGAFCTALTATPSAAPDARRATPSTDPPTANPGPGTRSPRSKTG